MASGEHLAGTISPNELLRRVGANILRLAREETDPEFLTRRVETAELLDESTARRSVECHLSLAPFQDQDRWPLVAGELYVPLARLRRDIGHVTFTVVDELGGRVPRLTKHEERNLVLSGVLQHATEVLNRPPKRLTSTILGAIVLADRPPDDLKKYCHDRDRDLLDDKTFEAVLLEAHRRFYLIVPLLPGQNYRRRVITYSYEDQPTLESRYKGWVSRVLWARPVIDVDFIVPSAGDCSSYHFEVLAPPDIAIPHACSRLVVKRAFTEDDYQPSPIYDDDRSERRAHFFYDGGGSVKHAGIEVPLLLAKTGITFSMRAAVVVATLLSVFAALVSWLGSDSVFESENTEAWVTVLLAAPAVVTAIIAIRSGHGLTSNMTRDARVTAALPAFALFCAAVAIVIHPPGWALRTVWSLVLVAAGVACWRLLNERRVLNSVRSDRGETWRRLS